MPCLRETSVRGRNGDLICDETNCSYRFFFHPEDAQAISRSKEANQILDYRLRTGSPENSNNQPCVKLEE